MMGSHTEGGLVVSRRAALATCALAALAAMRATRVCAQTGSYSARSAGGGMAPSLDAQLHMANAQAQAPAARVEELLQLPEFPSGCEPASLAIVLRAHGFAATLPELVEGYFTYDDTWEHADRYQGDPRGAGSAMPPAVVAAATQYLQDRGSGLTAEDLTGSSFGRIKDLVKRGLPVMVWSTVDAEAPVYSALRPSVEGYPWYRNFHCVVMYGIKDHDVLVSDPLVGLVRRDLSWFSFLYRACGQMAVVVS